MKFILLINVKMPTIVDILTFVSRIIVVILTFMSRINTLYETFKARDTHLFQRFSFYKQLKFYHEKSFITLRPYFVAYEQ